jgi:hypothetical protein
VNQLITASSGRPEKRAISKGDLGLRRPTPRDAPLRSRGGFLHGFWKNAASRVVVVTGGGLEAAGGARPGRATWSGSGLQRHKASESRIGEAVPSCFDVTCKPVLESRVSGNRDDEVVPAMELT